MYNLGVILLSKKTIPMMPKVKKKYFNKYTTLEIDVESYSSNVLNIIPELLEPEYTIELPEHEKSYPEGATYSLIKNFKPWINITILGHDNNLLIKPEKTGIIVNHFSERFTANKKGAEYYTESYGGEVFKNLSKEM